MITVQVKTPKEKQAVEIEENAQVRKVCREIFLLLSLLQCSLFQFKEAISAKFNNAPIENLCLIFAGKILKDSENLGSHNIKDGMTIHLVIKHGGAAPSGGASSSAASAATTTTTAGSTATPAPAPAPAPDVGASPFGLGGFGGIPGAVKFKASQVS